MEDLGKPGDRKPLSPAGNGSDRLADLALGLSRYQKRAILIALDLVLLQIILWLAYSWRYGGAFVAPTWLLMVVVGVGPFLSCIAFFQFGLYRMVTRFMDARAINAIAAAMVLSTLLWALMAFLIQPPGFSRAALAVYPILGTIVIWINRQFIGWALRGAGIPVVGQGEFNRRAVIVYGAGPAGVQLAQAIERSDRLMPIGFVDRNPTLWRQYVGGYRVHRPDHLPSLIVRENVGEIVVALENENRQDRAAIFAELTKLGVSVRVLPHLTDIATGRVSISDLRPVEVLDLLGRDAVPPNPSLLSRHIKSKSVLVTGAGGSIGSELCRQIVREDPSRLVILDASENALYEIEAEVRHWLGRNRAGSPMVVVAVLGSVLDAALITEVLETNDVRTVYHAAAYKHVPIVERNAALGILNNTFGTLTVAKAAAAVGVDRFVLVSTDKAVRPTNVMGASKRLAEMILQSLAAGGQSRTVFTMVRFGNVLDSSGSVMQRFRKQIAEGGPVTVTHPDMIRYFMSIPEAASLVIQAGAMAAGGEVFLLEMGKPVRIDDMARSMIRLSGLEVRSESNPHGDIAISYIGLRPGEKLREELLIGDESMATEHPRIFMSREPSVSDDVLEAALEELRNAIRDKNVATLHDVLRRVVEGYRSGPGGGLADSDSPSYAWPQQSPRILH